MIATFALFDLRNFVTTQPSRLLIALAFVIVFGATLPVPGLPILAGAVIASVMVSYPFQGDERGLLDTLYATSPISRRSVTIGRYVTMLALAAIAIGLGAASTFVIGAVRHQDVGWPLVSVMLLVSWAIVATALAVQLPWFFAMGFTRARPMVFIPVAVFGVLGWIAGQTGLLDGSSSIGRLGSPSAPVVALALAFGVVLLAVSAAIAERLYRRREL